MKIPRSKSLRTVSEEAVPQGRFLHLKRQTGYNKLSCTHNHMGRCRYIAKFCVIYEEDKLTLKEYTLLVFG